MPIPTPFHERTRAHCTSYRWKDWAGYYAVCSYDTSHEREYFAFRHSAGLLDATPLFKYEVKGKHAAEFLSRVMVREFRTLKPGRVTYCCWCDDHGKVLDDGTVTCLAPGEYFVTAADPTLEWFLRHARGQDVEIKDVTNQIGALALQGPNSRDILKQCVEGPVEKLKFFGSTAGKIDGANVRVTRTGYTGDLGYEVWALNTDCLRVWDAIVAAGKPFGIEPAGLDALDVARMEAGFILAGVDYVSAKFCPIESRKVTPYEIDLGWTVSLERDPFIGQRALRAQAKNGPPRKLVGLDISWNDLEKLYDAKGLPALLPVAGWRMPIPIYDRDTRRQIGRAMSGSWSPTLKRNLALGLVESSFADIGTVVHMEQTVEYVRHRVDATVINKPLFDPERKRA